MRPLILSKEAEDKLSMRQWETEPPPEGGYEVVLIVPFGVGADEFAVDMLEMSRYDVDMAGITAFGCGMELTVEEMRFVQLGGLRSDGFNLLLEKRELRKEVAEEARADRVKEFREMVDNLVKGIEADTQQQSPDGAKEEK